MIGRLTGILVEKNPPQLLLDVQGVAYEVDVPMSTFYNLPATGERIALFTHMVQGAMPSDTPVLFICRSGGRSNMAATALAAAGFTRCYNILEGFEGDKDAHGQRNRTGGWRAAGLPWYQS